MKKLFFIAAVIVIAASVLISYLSRKQTLNPAVDPGAFDIASEQDDNIAQTHPKPKTPAGAGTPKTLGAGDYDFSLVHGGLTRNFKVHVPGSYDRNRQSAVILNFHGGGGTSAGQIKTSKMNEKSDREGYITVYPEGTGKSLAGKKFATWNALMCCNPAVKDGIDDVGFVSKMIDKLEKDFNIDPKRIYATGHSNGGYMVSRLACELPGRIAAVAAVASTYVGEKCGQGRAVPVLHIRGTEDKCSFYKGGTCGGCFADFFSSIGIKLQSTEHPCESFTESFSGWKDAYKCQGRAMTTYLKGDAKCESVGGCRDNAEVTFCTIQGGGHGWPGGTYGIDACESRPDGYICKSWKDVIGKISNDLNANDLMWEFFKKHPQK